MGRKKKAKAKVVIVYPELRLKKWVPPDQRKKKKRKKPPPYPPQITEKSRFMKPKNTWHAFEIIHNCGILLGGYSLNHCKFSRHTKGYQGSAICVIAVLLSRLVECISWESRMLDTIITFGDRYYFASKKKYKDKHHMKVPELLSDLYLYTYKITLDFKGPTFTGSLYEDKTDNTKPHLVNVIKEFLASHDAGVISMSAPEGRCFAFWKFGKGYYLFDPTDHDEMCWPHKGFPGNGVSFMVRFPDIAKLVQVVQRNMPPDNAEFDIFPVRQKIVLVNTEYPSCLLDDNLIVLDRRLPKKTEEQIGDPNQPKGMVVPEEEEEKPEAPEEEAVEEILEEEEEEEEAKAEDVEPSATPSAVPEDDGAEPEKKPPPVKKMNVVEPPRVSSVTYFCPLDEDKLRSILMAETSKTDPDFERCPRQDTFSSVAALVMLREVNSKHWTSRVVTNILRFGFRICMETKKIVELNPELNEFKLKAVERKMTLNDRHYLPKITPIGCRGKLLSVEPTILDLLPALEQVLARCDTVVVQGPNIVSVWKEGELYYMFDPGERDPNGSAIVKEIRVGSVMETVDFISGASCVMQFKDLEDLVKVYMNNVEKPKRKDPFVISNVEIKDFIERPEDWFNFKALEPMRWILFGNFSQSDPRFDEIARTSQCTADAAMCLAYLHIRPIAQWDSSAVDHILVEGHTYYNQCVETLKACEKFVSPMLFVPELLKSFILDNQLVVLDIEECLFNGAISVDEGNNKLSLSNVLREFFRDYDYGIVTSCGISVAVFKKGDGYFYFDSHSRNEQGLHNCHGKACVQRVTCSRKLADCILANLALKSDVELFNIAGVKVDVFQENLATEPDEDDDDYLYDDEEEEEEEEEDPVSRFNVQMPELYYTRLTKKRAILRSRIHQGDAVFGTNAGKQSVPNMMVALGLANLYQARFWDVNNVDDVLHQGDALYAETMETNCLHPNEPPEATEDDVDPPDLEEVTTENVVKTFKIGVNKFTVEFGEKITEEFGEYGNGLREALNEFLRKERKDDESRKEAIIKTPTVNLVIWRDGPLYYAFDPNARDNRGEVYGKDEWSLYFPPVEEEEEPFELDEAFGEGESFNEGEEDNTDYVVNFLEKEWIQYGEDEEEEEEVIEEEPEEPAPKHPPEYWKDLEEKNGKACVLWFTKARHLIKHIVNNNPPQDISSEFTITPITMTNRVALLETKPWKSFEAFGDNQWILRANMSQNHEMFPAGNRGAQSDANCLLFLAHSELFSLSSYTKTTLDEILKYGDRLYTHAKKLRRKQLQDLKDPNLYPSEIETIVARDTYTVDKLPKHFCIGHSRLRCTSNDNFVIGEVYDKTSTMSLNNSLPVFFQEPENCCAILTSKGVSVAIRQALNRYYMFDPHPRGPKAQVFEGGVACLTRFRNLDHLAEVFLKTLPVLGKNFFALHRIIAEPGECGKPVKVEVRHVDDPLKIYGFVPVFPGKMMIRGTISQDEPSLGRGTNAQCSPIAFVALAMTLIHSCEFWTKPIVDEVILIGDRIYGDLLDRCDFDFNPWEERLMAEKTPRDFKVGKIKVNCELRDTTQSGIIDIIDPQIINIRQGIERFFEENSYGVIETENLTVAVWEAEDEEHSNWIYMFDPNPRGATGQPLPEGGVACALKFCGSKIMADHIVSLLHSEREGRFTIYPVEIVIERDGKRKKTKKYGLTPVKREACGAKNKRLGRCAFYAIPDTDLKILRGMKNQCDEGYCCHSRGNQGIPNCIVSYVMDKLIPLTRWNFKSIDMILDVGDQLYKDSFILYNPVEKKLPLESVIRDIVIKDVRVKISVGAPVLAAKLDKAQLTEALEACFNLKSFCILIVDYYTISIFKKEDCFFIFDPAGMDLTGKSDLKASAAVLQIPDFECLIDVLMENASAFEGRDETLINRVFKVIVIGIKEIQKVPVGATFDDRYQVVKKEKKNCDKVLFTTCPKRKRKKRRGQSEEEEEEEGQE